MERGGKESDFKSGGTKEAWNENTKEKEMFKTEKKDTTHSHFNTKVKFSVDCTSLIVKTECF